MVRTQHSPIPAPELLWFQIPVEEQRGKPIKKKCIHTSLEEEAKASPFRTATKPEPELLQSKEVLKRTEPHKLRTYNRAPKEERPIQDDRADTILEASRRLLDRPAQAASREAFDIA